MALVHCKTGAGVLNPLYEVALIVAEHKRSLIVRAMRSIADALSAMGIKRTPSGPAARSEK